MEWNYFLFAFLPILFVSIMFYFIFRMFIKSDEKKRRNELAVENNKIITPIRLQAYERLTVFLERVSADSLLMRYNLGALSSKELHSELLSSIRAEFEHNVSQQVYVSFETWEMVKNAKNHMIQIINRSSEEVEGNTPGFVLSKKIIENIIDLSKSPTNIAIEYIKNEISGLF